MNSPRCGDVDKIESIHGVGSALASGPFAIQVELCVFENVIGESRGDAESRSTPGTRFRLEGDGAIEVTGQPDGHVGGRGDLEAEGASMGGHGAALVRK